MDHIQKQPPSPSERTTAQIPPALDAILLRCLSKDPNDRPQTMQDLAESLARVPLAEVHFERGEARRELLRLSRGVGIESRAPALH